MEQNDNSPWDYKPDGDDNLVDVDEAAPAPAARPPRGTAVSWQAPEFIEHQHSAGWYGSLILITVGLTALVYFLTKDYVATGTIPVVGIIVGIFAGHKADSVQYELSSSGLSANGKQYAYGLFKSFFVLEEGQFNSVNLTPLKRFMPPVSAYFPPADQEKIVNALGNYLPYEERKMDSVDRLTRRLRL